MAEGSEEPATRPWHRPCRRRDACCSSGSVSLSRTLSRIRPLFGRTPELWNQGRHDSPSSVVSLLGLCAARAETVTHAV